MDWLLEQPGVDAGRVGFYGLSLGSVVALYTAVRQQGCSAIVVEDATSLRDAIAEQQRAAGSSATFGTGIVEFTSLPDGVEPSESAAQLVVPSLWPEQVAVTWRQQQADGKGGGKYEVALDRRGATGGAEPWAVQVCALDLEAKPTFQNAWLAGAHQTVPMTLPAEPGVVGAMRLAAVERTEAGSFQRALTPLSRAGRWYEERRDLFAALRVPPPALPALPDVKAAAAAIRERGDLEPLPAQLEAELADVFSIIGRVLAGSSDAEDRARGITWLQRAVSAEPAHPERHFWPGQPRTTGFQHAAAVAAARARLTELTGR
jgi:hypothetical protein